MANKRKKPRSVARNLLIVAAVFIPVLLLVLFARSRNREVELILPEEHAARAALRTSTENGYGLLLAAADLLPARPNAVEGPSADQGGRPWEEPDTIALGEPSLARLCGIDLPDSDPQVSAYIKATAPAATKAREALAKSHIISPQARRYRDNQNEGQILGVCKAMVALGRVQFDESPTVESLAPLVDAIKVMRALCKHETLLSWADVIEGAALQQLRAIATRPEGRAAATQVLDALGPGYLPRRDVMHNVFLHIDDQLTRKESVLDMRGDARFYRGAFLYELQRLARVLKQNKDALLLIADQRPPDMDVWMYKNARQERGPDDPGGTIRRINLTLSRAGELASDFEATRTTIALEAFKADTGAYPPALDALVPKNLPTAPIDPYANAPFGYKVVDAGYLFYSVGHDLADDAGDPAKDRVIQVAPVAAAAPAA